MLKRLQGATPHVCEFIGCGRNDKVNYVIMTLLGPSLSELRKRQHQQKFTHSTVLRVGIQIISAIRSIHNCGFLHRDIKPSNFAIGATPDTSRTCYMLDFGLSRQYTTLTGEVRQPRVVAGFRGTVRYASLNAHLSNDLGRHDDLWSVFYMLVELAVGQLPWRRIRDKEEAGEVKAQYDHKKLIKSMPYEFLNFLNHLKDLTYFQKPDYAMLINLFKSSMKRLGIHESDPYDWEQDYSAPSLTTASVGSPPAVKIVKQNSKEVIEVGGGKGKKNVSSSKTNCSEVEDLSDNPPPPAHLSPTPRNDQAKELEDYGAKASPVETNYVKGDEENDKHQVDNVKNLLVEQIDGENDVQQPKVEETAHQNQGAEEEPGKIKLSEKLEIDNRYESEDETSSTLSTSESEEGREEEQRREEEGNMADVEEQSNNLQPFKDPRSVPLQLVDKEWEPLHRYGSITPMKSIHTDSLNKFFDMGIPQCMGSSDTMGHRFRPGRPGEEGPSGQQENMTTSSKDSESQSSHPLSGVQDAEIHPDMAQKPKQGYSAESDDQLVDGIESSCEQEAAPVIKLDDCAMSTSTGGIEMDKPPPPPPPRVIRLTNGFHDSDSSRSVQIVSSAISDSACVQESTNEQQDHFLNPIASQLKETVVLDQNNIENAQATSNQKHVQLPSARTPTNDRSGTVNSTVKAPLATGQGRKLPATPVSATVSTVTSKLSPLQSNSPLSHLPDTPMSLNEGTRQDIQVLQAPPLIPRPPENPPPANYTANILARRRRFIRSQQK